MPFKKKNKVFFCPDPNRKCFSINFVNNHNKFLEKDSFVYTKISPEAEVIIQTYIDRELASRYPLCVATLSREINSSSTMKTLNQSVSASTLRNRVKKRFESVDDYKERYSSCSKFSRREEDDIQDYIDLELQKVREGVSPKSLNQMERDLGLDQRSLKKRIKYRLQNFYNDSEVEDILDFWYRDIDFQERYGDKSGKRMTSEKKKELFRKLKEYPPDPLESLSFEFNLNRASLTRYAKQLFPKKADFDKRWKPNSDKITQEQETCIRQHMRIDPPLSFDEIGEKCGASHSSVQRRAEKFFSEGEYKKRWLANIHKFSPELKSRVLRILARNPPLTLDEVSKLFPNISYSTIRSWAVENFDDYEERFPNPKDEIEKIDPLLRGKIESDIAFSNLNLSQIAFKYSVSHEYVRKVSIRRVFRGNLSAHRERFQLTREQEQGIIVHSKINSLMTLYMRNFQINYCSESKVYKNSKRIIDGFFLDKEHFIFRMLKSSPALARILGYNLDTIQDRELLQSFKAVLIDYTSYLIGKNIGKKVNKYENPDVLLLIVGTKWYDGKADIISTPRNSRYPRNVKIISPKVFLSLFNFHSAFAKPFKKRLLKILKLNQLNDIEALEKIKEISKGKILRCHNVLVRLR